MKHFSLPRYDTMALPLRVSVNTLPTHSEKLNKNTKEERKQPCCAFKQIHQIMQPT